jgi:WD40 repeat protein
MSGLGITVRCLASTRVPTCGEPQQERDQSGEDEDVRTRHSLDGTEEEEVDVTSREEALEQSADVEPEDDSNAMDVGSPTSQDSRSSSSDTDTSDSSDSISLDIPQDSVRSVSCIQEAQLSPDGFCIFTSDRDRIFSVYPIDSSTLPGTSPRPLVPYASFRCADPIWAFAVNPLFNVQDPTSTTVLVSRRDSYITLHNALWDTPIPASPSSPVNIARPLASYKLVNGLTEAITAPLSLTYSNSGRHFFAGIQDTIAIFDLSETDSPIHRIPTIPAKRNKLKGGGRGFKGHMSALSLSPPSTTSHDGLLAAGSWTRNIGIYDPVSGGAITHFSLPGTLHGRKIRNEALKDAMGDGVSSLKWSPCGKYLYVAERSSNALLIYDVRNFSLSLGYCTGRQALMRQKLGFDIWNAGASPFDIEGLSHEVWAGGSDGRVRVWRDPYTKEGAVSPDETMDVGGGGPVTGTLVHASGGLAVVARGGVEMDEGKGRGVRPRVREWGSLDMLGLG